MEVNKMQRLLQLQLSPDPLIRSGSDNKETSSTAFRELLNDLLRTSTPETPAPVWAAATQLDLNNQTNHVAQITSAQTVGANAETPAISSNQAAAYAPLINMASERYGVPKSLIEAVIQAESNFRPDVVSSAGAKGLMQLMDKTAEWLGVKDSFDPAQNIDGGTRYLAQLLERYQGSIPVALAAYNSGPGTLSRLGITNEQDLQQRYNLLPAETRRYVPKVEQYLQAFSTNG